MGKEYLHVFLKKILFVKSDVSPSQYKGDSKLKRKKTAKEPLNLITV